MEHISNKKSKQAKLKRHLLYRFSSAVRDYNMIEDGDHVMVCHSGGKDSFALFELMCAYRKKAKESFRITAVNLDHHFPGYPKDLLPGYFKHVNMPLQVIEQDIYGVLQKKKAEGKHFCSLCSRLRRGALYRFAEKNNVTKMALGHHKNDMVETLFLNMFYGGQLKSMPPKLLSRSGKTIVIRPMAYINEQDLVRFSRLMNFPLMPDKLCGAGENKQRKTVKAMIEQWQHEFPGRMEQIFRSTQTVTVSHLADRHRFDFNHLTADKDHH